MTDKVLSTFKPKFQKKATNFSNKTNHNNTFLLGFFIWVLGFPINYFCQRLYCNPPYFTLCGEITRKQKVKQFLCELSFFDTHSWRTLPSFGHSCVPMNTNLYNILWFSCPGKSRDIVYQHTCWFSWLIFVQHGLFGILLTVSSALSPLTDHGIYYIIRCGNMAVNNIFISHISIYNEKLRKVIPPKLYLSFFVQYTCI